MTIYTTGENLIRTYAAEMPLLRTYYMHFCLGHERNLGHVVEQTPNRSLPPQREAGLPPINSSWIGLARAVVVRWPRRDQTAPELRSFRSSDPRTQEALFPESKPITGVSPSAAPQIRSPGHHQAPNAAPAAPSYPQKTLSPKPAKKLGVGVPGTRA